MVGLRMLHVTSIPGDIGSPVALPTSTRSAWLTRGGSARGPGLKWPAAHCWSRKYWVSVNVENLTISSLLTELVPELSGSAGEPLDDHSTCVLSGLRNCSSRLTRLGR